MYIRVKQCIESTTKCPSQKHFCKLYDIRCDYRYGDNIVVNLIKVCNAKNDIASLNHNILVIRYIIRKRLPYIKLFLEHCVVRVPTRSQY